MIALHISILDGIPFLWSEGKKIGMLKELRLAMEHIGMSSRHNSTTKEFCVWMPSLDEKPLPSSPLIGAIASMEGKKSLNAFPITALRLNATSLTELTLLADKGNIPGSGIIFGSSLLWLRQVRTIALNIIRSQSLLPSVVRMDKCWEALWQPLPETTTSLVLEKVAETMPAVCRSLSRLKTQPPDVSKQLTLKQLLSSIVNELLRPVERADTPKTTDFESIHDAWLHALSCSDARVHWKNEQEIEQFACQLNAWRRPIELHEQSPFKFCFQLAEPPLKGRKQDRWHVNYQLQLKADPSLMLNAGELWNRESAASQHALTYTSNYTEFMLTELGQASALYPAVTRSLKKKNPGGFDLDTEGAYQFLLEYAELLRGAGFVVMLPSWWTSHRKFNRIGIKTKVKLPAMSGSGACLTLNRMIACDYAAALGNEELDLEELKTLAELKAPLVRVRGQWTQIDHKELAHAVHFLEKNPAGELSARELLATALGAPKKDEALFIRSVEVSGWLQELLEKLSSQGQFELLQPPLRFQGTLRAYQERGFSWLSFLRKWGLGACLADDMGLGKTIQTLAMVQREREQGEKRATLLICPTSVVNNWRKEAERFTPDLDVLVHHGGDRMKTTDFRKAASGSALVISTYGLLQRDLEFLSKVPWAGIILDEAQNIKNPETKQSKAARTLRADYRIALTGTPVENHVGDLWAVMDFLNPGFLGTQNVFRQNFYTPIQWYGDTEASARLKSLTAPFILRRMKTDKSIISDLPEKIEMKEYCSLTREQASLYKAVVDELQGKIESAEGIDRRGLVLALLVKLKQVCNHPAHFLGDNSAIEHRSGKMKRLTELLGDIREAGEKTLIFTQFTQMGTMLQHYLQEFYGEETLFLHGGITKKRRDEIVERFQQEGSSAPAIFILSLKAGGTGLNLTTANHVVHFDRWWNPAVENQATDRAFRIGQHKNVAVHKFITTGTLEERIDEMIEKKTTVAGQILGTGEQWLTELSNNDLRDLIMLSQDAMGE